MDVVNELSTRLGYLFYIVNPSTSVFETIGEIPNYVADVFPWFFTLILLERVILYAKRGRSPPMNDALTSVAAGLFLEIKNVVFRGSSTLLYIYIYEKYCLYSMPWDSVYTWVLSALLYDLGYYWGHRAAHEVNLFWSQHQVHHSSEEYNLSTALRQAAFQGWTTMFFYLPMALIIPPTQFIVHSQFNLLYQFWIHTEIIDDLGPLEWILNTPSHHRVHHGASRYCIDKNYAGVLIIWDRMFGTFEAEKRDQPIVYGLIDQVESFNPFYLQFFYLEKVFKKMLFVPGLINKLRALFYGPGWMPGTSRLGNYEDLPETIVREKYKRKMSRFWQIYSLIHFTILSVAFQVMGQYRSSLEPWMLYSICAYLLLSLLSLGLLYEGSHLFYWLEMFRCLLFLGLPYRIAFDQHATLLNVMLWATRLFYFFSAWISKTECVKVVSIRHKLSIQ